MRIALVIPEFDPSRGGAERWTYDFAGQLVARGHEVHVVAERFADVPEGVAAHRVESRAGGWSRRLSFAAEAEAALRRLDCEIVHDMGHGWYGNVFLPHGGTRQGSFRQNLLWQGRVAGWLKRAGAGVLPRYRTFRKLEERQYRCDGSRLFVALSEMVKRDMVRYHGVPDDLVRVVYNGVDTERFSPVHRARDRDAVRRRLGVGSETLFLLVAHNFRLKGLFPLIEAMGLLAREGHGVRLAVVGRSNPRSFIAQARRQGCQSRVAFLGDAGDPVPLYAAADVYVQPTFYDPCSLVVLEALASGLPVITSVYNGAGELLTPPREGYVLNDPADVRELAGRMRELLERERREEAGGAARRLAEAHSVGTNTEQLLAVYREALRLPKGLACSRSSRSASWHWRRAISSVRSRSGT